MRDGTKKLPQARHDELFIEDMDGELLVYDAKHFCAHRLNPTAAWIWRHCDGQHTVAQATQLLSDELNQPVDEELVWLSLDTLDKTRLLVAPPERPSSANDDSRRAMIQKMAMAGGLMFLLPAITPLTKVARAASPIQVSSDPGPALKGLSTGTAVWGESKTWMGVYGKSTSTTGGFGVMGVGIGSGVAGESETWHGVYGKSKSMKGGAGVMGEAIGPGVIGKSQTWFGIFGETDSTTGGSGVGGVHNGAGSGVQGKSKSGIGVLAISASGTALHAESQNGGRAGFFKGDVEVTGDIRLPNADCAEDFDIMDAENVEAGSVMVLCGESALQMSQTAYDKRVAGVISGAGDYKPGLILDTRPTGRARKPVALMGKVFCKADARYGAIETGDLLTTSDTPGHVMKATDTAQTPGAVVGKALRGLTEGQGLIPILVSLQ
ncbi:PqqD family protein [bacterium]|nr:MAG: PqqD family protein [bacterium]